MRLEDFTLPHSSLSSYTTGGNSIYLLLSDHLEQDWTNRLCKDNCLDRAFCLSFIVYFSNCPFSYLHKLFTTQKKLDVFKCYGSDVLLLLFLLAFWSSRHVAQIAKKNQHLIQTNQRYFSLTLTVQSNSLNRPMFLDKREKKLDTSLSNRQPPKTTLQQNNNPKHKNKSTEKPFEKLL